MSFHTSMPTQQEITSLLIYDLAMEDWNPQTYYDGLNDDLSIMSSPDSGENDQHIVNSSVITNSEILSEYENDAKSIELQPEILEYIDYNNPTLDPTIPYIYDAHLLNHTS